jgi:hypothetical protein
MGIMLLIMSATQPLKGATRALTPGVAPTQPAPQLTTLTWTIAGLVANHE